MFGDRGQKQLLLHLSACRNEASKGKPLVVFNLHAINEVKVYKSTKNFMCICVAVFGHGCECNVVSKHSLQKYKDAFSIGTKFKRLNVVFKYPFK